MRGGGGGGYHRQSSIVNRGQLSIVNCQTIDKYDGQTDSVKKNRIRLSVVIPSAVRWLGTALDGQTRLSVVIPSAVAGYERTRMRCCNDDDELDGEVVEI